MAPRGRRQSAPPRSRPARAAIHRGTRSRSRFEVSGRDLPGLCLLARRLVFFGDRGKSIEVKQDHAAAHAGPRIDLLDSPAEPGRSPGLFPKIGCVAGIRALGADQVSRAQRALSLEFGHGERAKDISKELSVFSRQFSVSGSEPRTENCELRTPPRLFFRPPPQDEILRRADFIDALDRSRVG